MTNLYNSVLHVNNTVHVVYMPHSLAIIHIILLFHSFLVSRVVPPDSLPPLLEVPAPSSSPLTPVNTPPAASTKFFPRVIQKLLDMGFSSSSAQQAIDTVGEDIDKAVSLLTEGEVEKRQRPAPPLPLVASILYI